MSDNNQRQLDEIEALKYLLPDGCFTPLITTTPPYQVQMTVRDPSHQISSPDSRLTINITIPPTYPSTSPPQIHFISSWMSTADQRAHIQHLNSDLFQQEEVIFPLFEYLRDNVQFPTRHVSQIATTNLDTNSSTTTATTTTTTTTSSESQSSLTSDSPFWSTNPLSYNRLLLTKQYKHPPFQLSRDQVISRLKEQYHMIESPKLTTHSSEFWTYYFPLPRSLDIKGGSADPGKVIPDDDDGRNDSFSRVPFARVDIVEILTALYCLRHVASATHVMFCYQYEQRTCSKAEYLHDSKWSSWQRLDADQSSHPTQGSNGGKSKSKKDVKDFAVSGTSWEQGVDEDGEKNAGAGMIEVMDKFDCNALVVVVREFGGKMLGPARFRIISNLVAEALERAGHGRKSSN